MRRDLIAIFDQIPPILCRVLARKNRGMLPMTNVDIARRSGLCVRTVIRVSKLTTWRFMPLDQVFRFSAACGVNPFAGAEHRRFWRRRALKYLENGTPTQRRMLARKIDEISKIRRR